MSYLSYSDEGRRGIGGGEGREEEGKGVRGEEGKVKEEDGKRRNKYF